MSRWIWGSLCVLLGTGCATRGITHELGAYCAGVLANPPAYAQASRDRPIPPDADHRGIDAYRSCAFRRDDLTRTRPVRAPSIGLPPSVITTCITVSPGIVQCASH
jgi:hypothetical protein